MNQRILSRVGLPLAFLLSGASCGTVSTSQSSSTAQLALETTSTSALNSTTESTNEDGLDPDLSVDCDNFRETAIDAIPNTSGTGFPPAIYGDLLPTIVPELKTQLAEIVEYLARDEAEITLAQAEVFWEQVGTVEAASKERCDLPIASLIHFSAPIGCPDDLDDPQVDQDLVDAVGCRRPGRPIELPCWEDEPTANLGDYFHPLDCDTGERVRLYPSGEWGPQVLGSDFLKPPDG